VQRPGLHRPGSASRRGRPPCWTRPRPFRAARLAIWGGPIICLAALVTMWEELSTHVDVAVASEVILTARALWFARGLRLWWHWGRA
jgi:hypothetical protein